MNHLREAAPVLARVLLAGIFVWSGYSKLTGPSGVAGRIESLGLPYGKALAAGAGVLEVAGALALVLGVRARSMALALVGYLVLVTWLFHWRGAAAGDQAQLVQLLKNAGLAGGLLLVAAHGPGRLSVDP